MSTTLIGVSIMIIHTLRREMISSNVKHIVRTIKIVDHLNGLGNIVLGGKSEYVKVNLTLQKVTPIIGLAEKNVS